MSGRNAVLDQVCRSEQARRRRRKIKREMSASGCRPAVCLLLLRRGPSVLAVVDVQGVGVVRPRRVLHRSGALPLGEQLVLCGGGERM